MNGSARPLPREVRTLALPLELELMEWIVIPRETRNRYAAMQRWRDVGKVASRMSQCPHKTAIRQAILTMQTASTNVP
jgi:hypothetical protein